MSGRTPRFRSSWTLPLLLSLVLPLPLAACLWDTDTLDQERSRFPSALELITGKFPRHSLEFYEWRIQDRQSKLADASPEEQAGYYDDIAVSLDKLGRHDEAIEQMQLKEQLAPGKYETLANLGTFHIHAGRFQEGKRYIAQAIEVNPDAHFGREEIQLLLVDYLLTLQAKPGPTDEESPGAGSEPTPDAAESAEPSGEGSDAAADSPRAAVTLPLSSERLVETLRGFAKFVVTQRPDEQQEAVLEKARKGLLGMMRFGHYDSPILLEALGDLLVSPNHDPQENARRLAARAFLKASYAVEGEARAGYRSLAEQAVSSHEGLTLAELEQSFERELAEAEAWHASLAEQESQWIADPNLDPEYEFRKLYDRPNQPAAAPRIETTANSAAPAPADQAGVEAKRMTLALMFGVVAIGAVLFFWLARC